LIVGLNVGLAVGESVVVLADGGLLGLAVGLLVEPEVVLVPVTDELPEIVLLLSVELLHRRRYCTSS